MLYEVSWKARLDEKNSIKQLVEDNSELRT
jgi:hypothetical protein